MKLILHVKQRIWILKVLQRIYQIGFNKIGISPKSGLGHAMVYVKTEQGKHIIYDPNFAILAADSSVSVTRLYEIVKRYIKGERSYVSFYPCSLLPKNPSDVLDKTVLR